MTDTINVHEAITEVSRRIGSLAKEGYNSHQQYNFRGIDQLVTAVQPVLNELGVTITPNVCEHRSEDRVTDRNIQRWCTVIVDYTITGPAQYAINVRMVGEACDTADKAMNKALSNAAKYFYFQTFWFGVGGMDDGDFDHIESAPRQQARPAQAPTQTRAAAPSNGDDPNASSEKQQRMIWAMAHKTLGWEDPMMYQQIEIALGTNVPDLKMLSKRQASSVIEAFQAQIDGASSNDNGYDGGEF